MEQLTVYVERLIAMTGLEGAAFNVLTHITLAAAAMLLAWIAYQICRRVVVPLTVRLAEKTSAGWDDLLFNHSTLRAACRIVPAIVIWVLLPDVFYRYDGLEEIVRRFTAIYITVASMMFGISLVNSFKKYEDSRHESLQQYYHTFCGVLKVVIIFLSVIVMSAIAINRNPLTLIAGLGATSAILMLVFKDTISGLVAGVRLTSNDMLHKGDWITVQKAGVNGVVEEITLTTVKVRNFDNTILTVSPLTLVDESFQNWVGMSQGGGRRVKRMVYFDFRSICLADEELKASLAGKYGLRQDEMKGDVVNMTLFRRYVECYLRGRDDVNSDLLFMARQLEATNTGLPMEFYFFLRQKEWKPYEHHLAEIMEYIYAIVPDFGLRIYQRCSDTIS